MPRLLPSARAGCLMLVLAASPHFALAESHRLVVRHEGEPLGETPILADLGREVEPGIYDLKPQRPADLPPARAEVFKKGGTSWIASVLPRVSVGENAYEMVGPITPPPDPVVEVRPSGTSLQFRLRGEPFTTYLSETGPKPILYPLIGPTGEKFSRSFPMEKVAGEANDHPHQRSFWFTHGEVNGVDFWSEQTGHGSIRETSRALSGEGQALKTLRTTDDWLGPDGKKILEDERTLRIYGTTDARVLDYDVVLKATAGPVEFGDTKEGTFGIRVASSMDVKARTGGRIVNAEGLTDNDAWGKRSPWVDYSGPVAGRTVGIAILNHPDSFRHPTPWHVRDYGLFAANPFGKHDFGLGKDEATVLPNGESLRFRYRVILHKGDSTAARIKTAYEGYVKPPEISLMEK